MAEKPKWSDMQMADAYVVKNALYIKKESGEKQVLCFLGDHYMWRISLRDGYFNDKQENSVIKKRVLIGDNMAVDECTMAYLDPRDINNIEEGLKRMLDRFKNKKILTISHHKGFWELGGMVEIGLHKLTKTVHSRTNYNLIKKAGIEFSKEFLDVYIER